MSYKKKLDRFQSTKLKNDIAKGLFGSGILLLDIPKGLFGDCGATLLRPSVPGLFWCRFTDSIRSDSAEW